MNVDDMPSIATEQDEEWKRNEVMKFLSECDRPQSVDEIARAVHISSDEANHHVGVLGQRCWVDFVRRNGIIGFVVNQAEVPHSQPSQ